MVGRAEGEGIEPSRPRGNTAFPERPGNPYPAAFREVDPPGLEPGLPTCHAGVLPLDDEPVQSGRWDLNPRSPASDAGGLPTFLRPELATTQVAKARVTCADSASLCLTIRLQPLWCG